MDSDLVASEIGDNLKELEDYQKKIEYEAVGRQLDEHLEHQIRLENEAKQKFLDEQHRRNAIASSQDVEKCFSDVSFEPSISVAVHCKQELSVSKNVYAEDVDGQDSNLREGNNCVGNSNDKGDRTASNYLKLGSSDGEISNRVFRSKRRTKRKGKQGSSTKLSEGRYQAVSNVKENVKIKNSSSEVKKNDQVWNQDGSFHHSDSQEAEAGGVICINVKESNVFGAGLQNAIGEYNCFLNVIIQSLWHLRQFREEFLRRSLSEHVHVGDPCVVCELFEILTALCVESGDAKCEPVSPTNLRIALSNLYPESNFFQEGQRNDASEVLAVIFECLHQSFTSSSGVSNLSVENTCLGSWDCYSPSCIAHTLFGIDISERMNCYNCGLESRNMKYTSFFHNINASALRTMKVMCAEKSFDELVNLVEMNHRLVCDLENGGCGESNHTHHILSNSPHIFTTVLGWQNTCESIDDIKATVAALATDIDISVLYHGVDPKNVHRLVSVVCFYGQHYHCFAYSLACERWILYDDNTVEIIGTWEDVIAICEKGHLQPQVLFYEAAM